MNTYIQINISLVVAQPLTELGSYCAFSAGFNSYPVQQTNIALYVMIHSHLFNSI